MYWNFIFYVREEKKRIPRLLQCALCFDFWWCFETYPATAIAVADPQFIKKTSARKLLQCVTTPYAFFASLVGTFPQFTLPWKFIYSKISTISSHNLSWIISYGTIKSVIFHSSGRLIFSAMWDVGYLASSSTIFLPFFSTLYCCLILMKFSVRVSFMILY